MDLTALTEHPPFTGIGASASAALAAPSFLQSFPPGVVLARQMAQADFLFVLIDGQIEMRGEAHDREHLAGIAEPGAVLLADAVVLQAPTLVELRTVTPCRLIMTPAPIVRWAMAADLAFAQGLLFSIAQSKRDTLRELHAQKLRNGLERLAAWALRELEAEIARGESAAHARGFRMRHTKRALAELVGMTPENLSRSLPGLESAGLVFDGKRVEITDPERLRAFARSSPLMDDRDKAGAPARDS